MNVETLMDEATLALAAVDGGLAIQHIVLPRLHSFLIFLDSVQAVPARLKEINAGAFPDFVETLESRGIPDEELHLVLGSVRMALFICGLKQKDLVGLAAPRKRERTKDQGGKSRFILKKIPPKPSV